MLILPKNKCVFFRFSSSKAKDRMACNISRFVYVK